jgi:primosomal protein N' (replication factor Y)
MAAKHDYKGFAEAELDQRRELGYPPYGHLLRIVVTGKSSSAATERCRELAERLQGLPEASAFEVLGPAECPLANLKGRSRWQLLLKSPDRKAIHAATRLLRPLAGPAAHTQVTLDVDPISML